MVDVKLEAAALAYAEKEWDVILNRITSALARGFVAGMKEQITDVLRRAYLAGAGQRGRGE
jgi:hypothetical protein